MNRRIHIAPEDCECLCHEMSESPCEHCHYGCFRLNIKYKRPNITRKRTRPGYKPHKLPPKKEGKTFKPPKNITSEDGQRLSHAVSSIECDWCGARHGHDEKVCPNCKHVNTEYRTPKERFF